MAEDLRRRHKVSKHTLSEIRKAYESLDLPNTKIAAMFKEYGVTEKNIRDWAKKFEWRKPSVETIVPLKRRINTHKIVNRMREKHHDIGTPNKLKIPNQSYIDDPEFENIVELIQDMAISGYSKRQIKRYITDKTELNIDLFAAVYDTAMEAFEEYVSRNLIPRVGWHIQTRANIYRLALKNGDIKTALNALDSMAKLEGLVPDKPLVNINTIAGNDVVYKVEIPEEYQQFQIEEEDAGD